MSLANKYRPQTFDAMIGQEHIIDILKAQMLSRETLHHNYLLFGPRGTGKTTTARLIAKGLNCLDLQSGNPCNHCQNCQLINEGRSLDYVEIDAASHTGVDNIREEIIDKALYPPTTLSKKIYVIDEVHMLSKGAFNALLKTIEEPKNNVCFILATTEIHKVPDTIISRCQVFNYRKVPLQAMVQHLEVICQSEQLQATRPALEIIANLSEGHVRDAVKYIDQVSILGAINEENISKFLGVAGENTVRAFLDVMRTGERNQIFAYLDQIGNSGIDLSQFAKQTIVYIDQHLLESVDFYLEVCKLFGEILSTLRWYPYPLIAYKIAINSYLGNEKKAESGVQASLTSSGIPQSVKVASSESQASSGEFAVSSQSLNIVSDTISVPVSSAESDGVKMSKELSSGMIDTPSVSDFSLLWGKIVAQIPKAMVQSNLKDAAIIESVEANIVQITVITKIAEMLLANEENKKLIESLFGAHFAIPMQIQVRFENKESYFARKMGL